MTRFKPVRFLPLLILAIFAMSSCSGPKGGNVCKVNCGGGGGETLNVTASAVPIGVPGTISILSFTADISEITIKDASNLVMNITPSNPNVDLNKLLSDSVYLGHANPASSILMTSQITISSAQVVYCTSTTGVAGCNAGSIKTVTSTGSQTIIDNALPTFPSNATKMGARLEFNMKNALVLNATGTAVTSIDFTQPLSLQWEGLPLSLNLASGQLDYLEDITGVVTNESSTSVTIQSATGGTFTANIVTGTSNLLVPPAVGQVADMDVILNNDGTLTVQTFDVLNATSIDAVEGVIGYAPTLNNQFQFVVTNFQQATTGSLINTNLHLGDPVTVTLSAGTSFAIDAKGLTLPGGASSFTGVQPATTLLPGQVVVVSPTAFTGANGATPAAITVNGLALRFSRLSGFPSTAGPNFPFLPIGPYFGGQTVSTFETTGVTNDELIGGSLTPGSLAAIRGLYFGTSSGFAVAKVRQ